MLSGAWPDNITCMYALSFQDEGFDRLSAQAKALTAEIFSKIKPVEAGGKIPAQSTIDPLVEGGKAVYVLREGVIVRMCGENRLICLDEGDVAGIEYLTADTPIRLMTEFAVVVDRYDMADVLNSLGKDAGLFQQWNRLVGCRLAQYGTLLSKVQADRTGYSPRLRSFQPGEVIIKEGEAAHEVFNLVQGHAEVLVDGIKVGEVLCDELFGALAAMTGTPRTATVRATELAAVMVLPAEHFAEMVASRPDLAVQLVRDMSRAIVALNKTVAELQGGGRPRAVQGVNPEFSPH